MLEVQAGPDGDVFEATTVPRARPIPRIDDRGVGTVPKTRTERIVRLPAGLGSRRAWGQAGVGSNFGGLFPVPPPEVEHPVELKPLGQILRASPLVVDRDEWGILAQPRRVDLEIPRGPVYVNERQDFEAEAIAAGPRQAAGMPGLLSIARSGSTGCSGVQSGSRPRRLLLASDARPGVFHVESKHMEFDDW